MPLVCLMGLQRSPKSYLCAEAFCRQACWLPTRAAPPPAAFIAPALLFPDLFISGGLPGVPLMKGTLYFPSASLDSGLSLPLLGPVSVPISSASRPSVHPDATASRCQNVVPGRNTICGGGVNVPGYGAALIVGVPGGADD